MASRVVIVGAGVSGLSAARVLADEFDEVVLVERDDVDAVKARVGLPQRFHPHTLLARGQRELETLFPGFERRMHLAGAVPLDWGWDVAALRRSGWPQRERRGITSLFASRALIERVLRELLQEKKGVCVLSERSICELLARQRGKELQITGVRLRHSRGVVQTIDADLIVDASGRHSKFPELLRRFGITPPVETRLESGVSYASRWYALPPRARLPEWWWWRAAWIEPKPPKYRSFGVLFPVEGERVIATLGRLRAPARPSDAEFRAGFAQLRSPLIARLLERCTPLGPVHCNVETSNRFRHFERWPEMVGGLVAVGDSVCTFNPIYAQGMTAGVLCARLLGDRLAHRDPASPRTAREFFRDQAQLLRWPWRMAASADARLRRELDGTVQPGILAKARARYTQAFFAALPEDRALREVMSRVTNMLELPSALMSPTVVARILLATLRRSTRTPSTMTIGDYP